MRGAAAQLLSQRLEAALRWLTRSTFRSMALFLLLTFLPILLLTYYIISTSITNSAADALRSDRQVRDFSVTLLDTSMRAEVDALVGLADEAPLQRALRRQQFHPVMLALQRMRHRRPEFIYLAFYDLDGLRQASYPAKVAATQPFVQPDAPPGSPDAWLGRVLRTEKAYISPVLPAANGRPARIQLAVLVERGELESGVLVGELPVSAERAWVTHIFPGEGRSLYVVDSQRRLIAGPPKGPLSPEDLEHMPEIAAALKGERGTGEFTAPAQLATNVVSYAPLPDANQAVLIVRPVRFGTYLVHVFYDKLAMIAVIVFLMAMVGGFLLRAAFRYYLRYTQEVERSRKQTEVLLSSIGDGVFAVDGTLRIIEFNRAAAALTGFAPAEAYGHQYAEVVQLVDENSARLPLDPIEQAIQQRRPLRVLHELYLRRKDGSRLPIAISAAPLMALVEGDSVFSVTGCVVVFNDVSHEREVDRMKTEFISIASHQLRTPMTGVKGALSLLIDEVLGPLNGEQKQYLSRAYEANERLIALVNDLLNVSRIEQGRLTMQFEEVDLEPMLRAVISDLQVRASRYGQQISLECENQGPFQVRGDRMRLRDVFSNLVDNAIKYTPEKGHITLRLAGGANLVSVEISDTGVGIPADQLPALFQKFTRIPNPLSNREFGTGLGLYFVKSVVELHQGQIDVESHPGQGTTFRVRLPRYLSDDSGNAREDFSASNQMETGTRPA